MLSNIRILCVGLVVLLLSACGAPNSAIASRENDDVSRAAALLSAYYHGHKKALDKLIEEDVDSPKIQFMPLDQASRILAEDESPGADYRRRRAIAKLSVGTFDYVTNTIAVTEVRDALETLGALSETINSIEVALGNATANDPSEQETLVYTILMAAGLGSDCADSTTTVGYDTWTSTTVVAFTVSNLDRDFDELATILDPQNWSRCSVFFTESFVAREVLGSYPVDGNGDAEPAPAPIVPIPGSTWNGVLFEWFDFSFQGAILQYQGWFKNLLTIDANRTSDMFYFEYALYESIKTHIDPLTTISAGLAQDRGYMSVRIMPDDSVKITGLKVLKYDSQLEVSWLNPYVQLFLRTMGDEAASIACTCQVLEVEEKSIWGIIWEWLKSWWS